MTTDIYTKKVLIFGCGNTLFENDGFGPAVVEYIQANHTLPETVLVLDAGTGIRDFMFDLLLMDEKPETVIIIDAVTVPGRKIGDIFEMNLSEVPREKLSDFSLHQSPSSNLLKELQVAGGVDVKVLGMHTDSIPNVINPGLSPEVEAAVPRAAQWVMEQVKGK
ncbi:MAG: hydrogenase maturation protease [Desulfobacteraceae bacterium]|nr:hydrogenase maturation protease [Desulfobacteraceae bacterium]